MRGLLRTRIFYNLARYKIDEFSRFWLVWEAEYEIRGPIWQVNRIGNKNVKLTLKYRSI